MKDQISTDDLNKRGFEENDQREIIRQFESLGSGEGDSLQTWILRNDLNSKVDERGNSGRQPAVEAQVAEKLAEKFGEKII